MRMLIDRAYHAGKLVGRDLPEPLPPAARTGEHAVQILRTYPARLRRYPFAPLGERSIANAYRKVFARARRLIYVEDQYLWAPFVAELLAGALNANPDLHIIAVVPRYPDKEGRRAGRAWSAGNRPSRSAARPAATASPSTTSRTRPGRRSTCTRRSS